MFQGRTQKAKTTRCGVYAGDVGIRSHHLLSAAIGLAAVVFVPSTASADITAFFGFNPTPVARSVRGVSVGTGLVIVAFEFEYSSTSEDLLEGAPSLRTFM